MIKKFFPRVWLGMNVCISLLLLLSTFTPTLPPDRFASLWLLGLLFPFLFLANAIYIVLWLFTKKRLYSLVSGIAILLALPAFATYVSIWPSAPDEANDSFKVMTYNVKNFDLYNWSGNVASKESILAQIFNEGPDILCLQEFYNDDTDEFNTLNQLKKIYPYYHFEPSLTLSGNRTWGQATFTKYPIVNKKLIRLRNSKYNLCLITDVVIDTDTISVFNLHLQSVRLLEEEYKTVTKKHGQSKDYGSIISKLVKASAIRGLQANDIAEEIKSCQQKIILCGDFNDTPHSYAYRKLSRTLNDAYHQTNWGIGKTFNQTWFPLRIDHVLLGPPFRATECKTLAEQYSDHYPVIVKVQLLDD